MITSSEIRRQFLDFFEKKQHKIVPSAPVIPFGDPTLLFTNAGMNQFKEVFLGRTCAPHSRVADSQKCIRLSGKHNDLEEVGKDDYHHSFFEMLGNWSFGDYYKKEAIIWSWELLTEVWKLPKEQLYATVYRTDDEAFELWKNETDVPDGHILRFDEKDNFWEMGDVGPCGPCSEIHIDLGADACDMADDPNHQCGVNGDCGRFIELWNLVFIQYNRNENGDLEPLTEKFVDTGAGFERITRVLQQKTSNYDTDIFTPLLHHLEKIAKIPYQNNELGISFRVIADHVRALSFAIADGAMPGNEGRGYVLRRLLRRAARHGRNLGSRTPFIYQLTATLVGQMKHQFPELEQHQGHIERVIKAEEERFNLTLDKGLEIITQMFEKLQPGQPLSGKDAFLLHDTYGFPLDLTKVICEERGYAVDEAEFAEEMKKQKQLARDAASFKMETEDIAWIELRTIEQTEFYGYDLLELPEVHIAKYFIDDNDNVKLILDATPFYAESGGQVADQGILENEESQIEILDVQKSGDLWIHSGRLISGEITAQPYRALALCDYRNAIMKHHTATHLLHAALRKVLGEHVHQKGSLVESSRLRFDFTHYHALTPEEIEMVEDEVNRIIQENYPVNRMETKLEEAKEMGAMALFGEKYGEHVRVIQIKDYSLELCGGTHVAHTGEIGLFKILSEGSIAAGIRRIEAVAGNAAFSYWRKQQVLLDNLSQLLTARPEALLEKAELLIQERKHWQKEAEKLQAKLAGAQANQLTDNIETWNDIELLVAQVPANSVDELRTMLDKLRNRLQNGIAILGANINDKANFAALIGEKLTGRYHAGKLIREVAKIAGGGGGGKPDFATAGAKQPEKIPLALASVKEILNK